MIIYIKQHLSNIWSSIYENFKQHRGWVKKSVAYKKNVYLNCLSTDLRPNTNELNDEEIL